MAAVVDFLLSICGFVYSNIKSVIWIISSIPQFSVTIGAIFEYCPTFLLVFLEVSLAVTILFAVLKLL